MSTTSIIIDIVGMLIVEAFFVSLLLRVRKDAKETKKWLRDIKKDHLRKV